MLFSLVFLSLERREFRISSLPQPLPPGGPWKQYFLAQQGKTSYFQPSFSHLLVPRWSPHCRQISPASDFLTTEPRLFCLPGARQGQSRNERTETVSPALGPRSLVIKFFNEHGGQGLERKVGVHWKASMICVWFIKSWTCRHRCPSNTHSSQELGTALSS